MKTKNWILLPFMAFVLAAAAVSFTGCKKSEHEHSGEHAHKYTCTHHPEVVQDKPGNCPKCGMKLVEKK